MFVIACRRFSFRIALMLFLLGAARPASADLYSMFVMSLEFIVDSSDIIVLADAVPEGQRFELRRKDVLRNLSDDDVPWPIEGADVLTEDQHEGHLKTTPVLLFVKYDEDRQRQRIFHHIWLRAPDKNILKIPIDELIHCLPHSDSGRHNPKHRWPVCLAVDGRRRLLTNPITVLRFVQRRINNGLSEQRPIWEFPRDRTWYTFGYHTYKNALWMLATEFDGDDTSWNILMPDDESTKKLVASEVDSGTFRYGWLRYLKRFADEPGMVARIQTGLDAKEDWVQWEARDVLQQLGVPISPAVLARIQSGVDAQESTGVLQEFRVPDGTATSGIRLLFIALGLAVVSAGIAFRYRWSTSVGN